MVLYNGLLRVFAGGYYYRWNMRLDNIDKNFLVSADITEQDITWFNVRQLPFSLHGIMYEEKYGRFSRMLQEDAVKISEGISILNLNTAGGRVRFCTDSKYIAICAIMENAPPMAHMPLAGQSGFDLYRKLKDDATERYYHTFIPPIGMKTGYTSAFYTDGALADYTIHFPLYDGVRELYIALKADAVLTGATSYRKMAPIVYYGSSITQGGCASHPGNSYQAIITRNLNVDFINLGFSGCCKGEDAMMQYLADMDMSIFVCDYDHNAPDAEHLENTHLSLYRAIRKKHASIPIIIISAPTILLEPQKYVPRREIVCSTYQIALAEGDKNIHYIDGAELFAGHDWDACTVDGVHPNDLGFYRMAKRLEKDIIKVI